MKKLVLLVAAGLLALSMETQAQSVAKPAFVGLSAGGVLVGGDLAKNGESTSDRFNGFSQYGYQVGLQGGYIFHKFIGVGARFGYTNSFGNTNQYNENVKATIGNSAVTVTESSTKDWTYNSISALVGPRFRADAGGVEFFLQPMAGFSTLGMTPIDNSYTTQTATPGPVVRSNQQVVTSSTFASGFAWGSSLGLRTATAGNVGFLFELNYTDLGSRKIEKSKVKFNNGPELEGTPTDVKTSASFFSVNFGLTFGF